MQTETENHRDSHTSFANQFPGVSRSEKGGRIRRLAQKAGRIITRLALGSRNPEDELANAARRQDIDRIFPTGAEAQYRDTYFIFQGMARSRLEDKRPPNGPIVRAKPGMASDGATKIVVHDSLRNSENMHNEAGVVLNRHDRFYDESGRAQEAIVRTSYAADWNGKPTVTTGYYSISAGNLVRLGGHTEVMTPDHVDHLRGLLDGATWQRQEAVPTEQMMSLIPPQVRQ